MEEKRPPPLLNLSLLKAAATRTGTGTGATPATRGDNATSSVIGARGAMTTTSSSSSTATLFDARRELAADLQRREAKRAQARAEAADTEGEASVLAALQAVHRLLRDAGEKEEGEFGNRRRRDFFRFYFAPVAGSNPDPKRRSRPFRDSLSVLAPRGERETSIS